MIPFSVEPKSVKNGVLIFDDRTNYWCNIDQKEMRQIINEALESNDWEKATLNHIPKYIGAITDVCKADAQFLLPINRDSTVLDAGAMWGALTVPVSYHCKEIYAVDQTYETLELLNIRAQQSGIKNITTLVSPLHKLPFVDGFFDCIILNGVLEWVGVDTTVVIDNTWYEKWKNKPTQKMSPRLMQLHVLCELKRVLKPEGCLYVAIENRYDLGYFFGKPDDHMNIKFVPFLPRILANAISQRVKGVDYRTYIYSINQLRKLLNQALFPITSFYVCGPHYQRMKETVPVGLFQKKDGLGKGVISENIIKGIIRRMVPAVLLKHVSPSICVIASCHQHIQSRIIVELFTNNLISNTDDYEAIICNNRFESELPVGYRIYNKKNNLFDFYVKISRLPEHAAVKEEISFLEYVHNKTRHVPELNHYFPQLLFKDDIDGCSILVTSFFNKGQSPLQHFSGKIRAAIPQLMKRLHLANSNISNVLEKRWVKHLSCYTHNVLSILCEFQKATEVGPVITIKEHIENLKDVSKKKGMFEMLSVCFTRLEQRLDENDLKTTLRFCGRHGDFDYCNLLVDKKEIVAILDFEHFEQNASPIFDVCNLLLTYPVLAYKQTYTQPEFFNTFVYKTGWKDLIQHGLNCFADLKGFSSINLRRNLHIIGTIEQQLIQYPTYRNAFTYSLFGEEAIKLLATLEVD